MAVQVAQLGPGWTLLLPPERTRNWSSRRQIQPGQTPTRLHTHCRELSRSRRPTSYAARLPERWRHWPWNSGVQTPRPQCRGWSPTRSRTYAVNVNFEKSIPSWPPLCERAFCRTNIHAWPAWSEHLNWVRRKCALWDVSAIQRECGSATVYAAAMRWIGPNKPSGPTPPRINLPWCPIG